jgi:ABC-type uncharacterized transport system substrate-binding protein
MAIHIGRRYFITLLGSAGAAAWLLAARAQQRDRMRRIGFLRVGPPPETFIDGFRRGLRELGLLEGHHFVIEYGLGPSAAQIPDTAVELVRRGVDIIVASGTPSVLPARDVAGQTPVVFVATLDPVATGLVASLAWPGRNITGVTSISGDVIAKRLQIIRELLPRLTRIAVVVHESSPTSAQYVEECQSAARNLGIELQVETARNPKDLEGIFVAVRGSGALVVADDAEFTCSSRSDCRASSQEPTADHFRTQGNGGSWRSLGLWREFCRTLSACGESCAQDPAGRQPSRSSGGATNKV